MSEKTSGIHQSEQSESTKTTLKVPTQPVPSTESLPKKKRKLMTSKHALITFISLFGILILLAVGIVAGVIISRIINTTSQPSLSVMHDGNQTITAEESSIASVAEKVAPSVVSIITETRSGGPFYSGSGQAAGTGIVVSKDGYVMTNNHVLENARTVSVVNNKGELYDDVSIIGRDPLNDIAFLKIKSDTTFTPAELGSSSTIRIGQQVVAIGNALGQYSNTVTSGIISGTGRPVTASTGTGTTESLTDLIQTDASINPGNSGGPLVNMAGQVIGINTAIVEDANGIGFAIPINATKGTLAGVLETGEVNRSYLGVNYLTITPSVAREYKLSVNNGAYIHVDGTGNAVVSGSPADKAGLKNEDIITKVNNEALGTAGSLSSVLGAYKPGDKVTLTYLRDGNERTTTVTLGTYKG